MARIERAGLEGVIAHPERPGTVLDLVGDAAVVVWLLGSASGDAGQLKAVHGPRLERLLERLVDTSVRGFAYEAAGSVPAVELSAGRAAVERASQTWRIPVTMLEGERGEDGWADRAAGAVSGLLGGGARA